MAVKDFTIFSHLPMKLFVKFFDGKNLPAGEWRDFLYAPLERHAQTDWNADSEIYGAYAIKSFDDTVTSLTVAETELLKTDFRELFKGWSRFRSPYAKDFARMMTGFFSGWMTLLFPIASHALQDNSFDIRGIPSNILRSVLRVARVFIQVIRRVNDLLGKGDKKAARALMARVVKSPEGRRAKIMFYQTRFLLGELQDFSSKRFSPEEEEDDSDDDDSDDDYGPKGDFSTGSGLNWSEPSIERSARNTGFMLEVQGQGAWVGFIQNQDYEDPAVFFNMVTNAMNRAAASTGSSVTFKIIYEDSSETVSYQTHGAYDFTMDFTKPYPQHIVPAGPAGPVFTQTHLELGLSRLRYSGRSNYAGSY